MPAVNSGRSVSEVAAAVREGVHFLRDDIGGFADRAGEDLGRLEHRRFDPLEGVEPADAVERLDHRVEAVGVLAPDILGAPDPLRTLAHRRALAFLGGGGTAGYLRFSQAS